MGSRKVCYNPVHKLIAALDFKYTPKHFKIVKKVQWQDVLTKISQEFEVQTQKFVVGSVAEPPTFIGHNDFRPGTLQAAYDEVHADQSIDEMHVYVSVAANSTSFGRHKDDMNVLIVQSIGVIGYKFDSGAVCTLNPGDSIFIPKGVYHDPIIEGPRATLSFSW